MVCRNSGGLIPREHLVAIDPGINATGVAHFLRSRLIHAHLIRSRGGSSMPVWYRALDIAEQISGLIEHCRDTLEMVLEWPQFYRLPRGPSPESLASLVAVDMAVLSRVQPIQASTVLPHAWKGSVDGDLCAQRVLRGLTEDERLMVSDAAPASLRHNVLDAVGLGQWRLAHGTA